jgi:hypothetical protein
MIPNTPSQRWARAHGACLKGRRRLGRLSIAQYFQSPTAGAWDLIWIARKLKPAEDEGWVAYRLAVHTTDPSSDAHRAKVRKALLVIFEKFDVRMPASLL